MVASAANLSTEMRDIGVAVAHERIAYNRLASAFAEHLQVDESVGLTVQALLGGEWRSGSRKKRLAIGSVVNAFDQMSCENARSTCIASRGRAMTKFLSSPQLQLSRTERSLASSCIRASSTGF